jgi:hypothetical protein
MRARHAEAFLLALLVPLLSPPHVCADGHRAEAAAHSTARRKGSNLFADGFTGLSFALPWCAARPWNPHGEGCKAGEDSHWSALLGASFVEGTLDDQGKQVDADVEKYFVGARYTLGEWALGPFNWVLAGQGSSGLARTFETDENGEPQRYGHATLGPSMGAAVLLDFGVRPTKQRQDIVRVRLQYDVHFYKVGDREEYSRGWSIAFVFGWEHHD